MKLSFANERILAIAAHPDDAELLCAGTLARARNDGATVAICVLCQGDKGQPAKPIAKLGALRRREMTAAARVLGAATFQAGIPDSTLTDNIATRRKLTEIVRRFSPTLLLAHNPEDYHADHRAASGLAEAASWSCASRGIRTKSPAMAAPPALWYMDSLALGNFQPGFFIDVSAYLEIKAQMLLCHRSQLARGTDQDFSPLAELMRQQAQVRGLQAGVAAAEAFRLDLAFKRVPAF